MLMNKQNPRRLIILLILLGFSMLVLAQGTDKQNPAPAKEAARSEEPVKSSPQASDAESGKQQPEGKEPAGSGSVTPIKEFKPTEQIEADSAVSFPIDI